MEEITISQPSDIFALTARIKDYFDRGGVQPIVFEVKKSSGKKRTVKQNRYYHGVVVDGALEHYKGNIESMVIDIWKATEAELTHDFVHELLKMLAKVKSTKKDTIGFEDLMTFFRLHFAEKGVDIREPNEEEKQGLLTASW